MAKNKDILLIYLTERGKEIAEQIKFFYAQGEILKWDEIRKRGLRSYWRESSLLIFIMALGIVARFCAPFISKKGKDPGIIVIDEHTSNVISYLGGHYAETNKRALELATLLGAHPCITTSSDLKGLPPLDLWIKNYEFILKNSHLLPQVMNKYNLKGKLKVWKDKELTLSLPYGLMEIDSVEMADIIISFRKYDFTDKLILIPKKLWAGLGFHETLTEKDFEDKIFQAFEELNLEFLSLKGIATHKKKASYLPLNNFTLKHKIILLSFDSKELSKIKTISSSNNVKKIFGIESISEASALCASNGILLVPKQVYKDMTLSIAIEPFFKRGKLYVIGLGPGDREYLTLKALKTLTSVEAVVGYKTYLKHIFPLLSGKEVYSFSMTEELQRVKKAVELVLEGKKTALISGGDPGIYGMSGLVLEYIANQNYSIEVEIIPGLSALNIGNALLGAPLANDFAVISLSDRLTPWETIEKRLTQLAQTDLPLVIYNPRSKGRKKQFSKALEIIKKFRDKNTYIGLINSATREGEEVLITTLENLPEEMVGMNTLLIIGAEGVKKLGIYLVSERGYERKYKKFLQNSAFNE